MQSPEDRCKGDNNGKEHHKYYDENTKNHKTTLKTSTTEKQHDTNEGYEYWEGTKSGKEGDNNEDPSWSSEDSNAGDNNRKTQDKYNHETALQHKITSTLTAT